MPKRYRKDRKEPTTFVFAEPGEDGNAVKLTPEQSKNVKSIPSKNGKKTYYVLKEGEVEIKVSTPENFANLHNERKRRAAKRAARSANAEIPINKTDFKRKKISKKKNNPLIRLNSDGTTTEIPEEEYDNVEIKKDIKSGLDVYFYNGKQAMYLHSYNYHQRQAPDYVKKEKKPSQKEDPYVIPNKEGGRDFVPEGTIVHHGKKNDGKHNYHYIDGENGEKIEVFRRKIFDRHKRELKNKLKAQVEETKQEISWLVNDIKMLEEKLITNSEITNKELSKDTVVKASKQELTDEELNNLNQNESTSQNDQEFYSSDFLFFSPNKDRSGSESIERPKVNELFDESDVPRVEKSP